MSYRRHSLIHLVALVGLASIGAASAVATTGCAAAPGPVYDAFLQSADTVANRTIVPRYETYVQTDATLSLEQKTSYLDEAAAFRGVTGAAITERRGQAPPGL